MCTVCQNEYEQIRITEGFDAACKFEENHSCANEKNRKYCSECGIVWVRCDMDLCLSCSPNFIRPG